MKTDYFNDTLYNKTNIIAPNEGESYELKHVKFTFKVTSEMTQDQLGIYEILLQPKTVGANLHYHRFMDEIFIVNKGILTIMMGDEVKQASAGTIVHIPRFTPHGFRNDSDKEVSVTLIFNPAMKREGFFKGLHETLSETPINPEKYLKLYNKYDSFPVDVEKMLPVLNKNTGN